MAATVKPKTNEHITKLHTALKGLLDAQKSGAGKSDTDSDGYGGGYDELASPIRMVKRHLLNKYVAHKLIGVDENGDITADSMKMAQSAQAEFMADYAEIGAKLGADTRDSLNHVVDVIKGLFPVEATENDGLDEDGEVSGPKQQEVKEALAVLDEMIEVMDEEIANFEEDLTTAARKKLGTEQFADPTHRRYPVNDKAHADNAMSRLEQNKDSEPNYAAIKARIAAAQKKFGEGSKKPAPKLAASAVTIFPKDASIMVESAMVLAEAEGSTAEQPRFKMLVIKEGRSGNQIEYPGSVLRDSAKLLEGQPIYVDHPEGAKTGMPKERSLATKVGWWTNPTYQEGIEVTNKDGSVSKINGTVAIANLFSKDASPAPWFPGMVQESLDRGNPSAVGISIYAAGKVMVKKDAGGLYKEAQSITHYASADAVAEPGAGGQPLALVASHGEKDPELKLLEEMSIAELREARPDLIDQLLAEAGKTPPNPPAPKPAATEQPAEVTTMLETLKASNTQWQEMIEANKRLQTTALVESKLSGSQLPEKVKAMIRADATDQILDEAAVTAMIAKYEDVGRMVLTETDSPTRLREGMIIPFGGSTLIENGPSPLDQVRYSLDHFFGVPYGDAKENPTLIPQEMKGKFPIIRSFAESYRQITGDYEINGLYDPKRSVLGDLWFREALPGATHVIGGATITMTNLLGTSMNKALFNFYQNQPRWWEPLVTKTDLQNMKQQNRIRLANFGSLTQRTVDGAEYTELDWAEVQEVFTPTEYGNVVPVGRRAIINDDLRGIQNIPRLLSASAIVTINEYVSNLITQSGGTGPTMTDTFHVLDAGNHQGNSLTLAFSRVNLLTARTVMKKMVNDAGKKIGIVPRWLVVPDDLEVDAWEIVKSEKVPESPNNAPNFFANQASGLYGAIAVPNFTDTNNWYLFADKGQIETIEMGFLFGNEQPELFQQDNPVNGMVFTNDVINHKIRWDFGGQVLDYRGIVGSIV